MQYPKYKNNYEIANFEKNNCYIYLASFDYNEFSYSIFHNYKSYYIHLCVHTIYIEQRTISQARNEVYPSKPSFKIKKVKKFVLRRGDSFRRIALDLKLETTT